MLPDLASHNCTHLFVSSRITRGLNSSTVRELTGEKLQTEAVPVAEEGYHASGSSHNFRLFLVKRGRFPFLALHIDSLPSMSDPPSDSPSVAGLLDRLKSLRLTSLWRFDMMFTLGPAASKAIFPIRLPAFGGAAWDEIRGLKGVKYETPGKKRIKYDLSIESPELKELYVNVEFRRREAFDIEMVNQALREGNGVVRAIIPESGWSD